LGGVSLRFFRLDPERLTALVSLNEQNFFQQAAGREEFALRLLSPDSPVAERFKNISPSGRGGSLSIRLKLLQLFLDAFGGEFGAEIAEPAPELDAKQRLANLLKQTPVAEWMEMAFPELARRMHCTPRHLSRIFHDLVGMSFRDKQTELRLNRARELLETTHSKVVDVALDSGYQSQSLFNLLFKRRFGVSPARWRHQHAERGNRRRKKTRVLTS
jgi:AraC-like DNA-binding protein